MILAIVEGEEYFNREIHRMRQIINARLLPTTCDVQDKEEI